MPNMVEVEHLKKSFGDLEVLKDISLTVIRCVNYLEEPTKGKVTVAGTMMSKKNHLEMVKKYSSMVFQQFNLYPHLTVLNNLTLAPMRLQHMPKDENRADSMLVPSPENRAFGG